MYAACKARLASKAIWIDKSTSTSCEAKRSLDSASGGALVVYGCETTSALHRAQLHSSCEVKAKALMGAIREATVALLTAIKTFSREARVEAPSGADSEATSLEGKALLNSAMFASNSRAKILSVQIVSPREAVSISPPARRTTS